MKNAFFLVLMSFSLFVNANNMMDNIIPNGSEVLLIPCSNSGTAYGDYPPSLYDYVASATHNFCGGSATISVNANTNIISVYDPVTGMKSTTGVNTGPYYWGAVINNGYYYNIWYYYGNDGRLTCHYSRVLH